MDSIRKTASDKGREEMEDLHAKFPEKRIREKVLGIIISGYGILCYWLGYRDGKKH